MAAVTDLPPLFGASKRRWWLVGIVVGWIVVLVGLSVWSVRHDPATVPEQRDIADAVPELQRAAGVLFAAADGDGRVVVLGGLEFVADCRITPVRHGLVAARDLTVYVRAGEAESTLRSVAAGLPAAYRADVFATRGGTRLTLHADAGNFIGVDTATDAGAKVLTLRLTSGCRPEGSHPPDDADPPIGPAPAALGTVLRALGPDVPEPRTQSVACPDGAVAGSYRVDDLVKPADFADRLKTVSAGATVVRSDESVWAYRTGGDSVVVTPDGDGLRVVAGRSCQ